MPAFAWSMPANRGTLRTSAASATSSDSQRAAFARASPSSRQAKPPRIGSQIRRLNRGRLVWNMVDEASRSVPELQDRGEQRDQAEDHGEGVVVEVTGLGP